MSRPGNVTRRYAPYSLRGMSDTDLPEHVLGSAALDDLWSAGSRAAISSASRR